MSNRNDPVIRDIWSGTDLRPLPYESVLSCMLRLAWRNACSLSTLRRLLGFRALSKSIEVESEALVLQTGWNLKEAEILFLNPVDHWDKWRWQCSELRFCPICMESAYHTDLFQVQSIIMCPLHHVFLTQKCQSCGRRLPYYLALNEIFSKPYFCKCGKPISGAAPSLDAHIDLQLHKADLNEMAKPYVEWWLNGRVGREQVNAMDGGGLQSRWCKVNEFLRSASCEVLVTLPYLSSFVYPPSAVTKISWKCKVWPNESDWYLDHRKTPYGRHSIAQAVYRATLNLLAKWLVTDRKCVSMQKLRHLSVDSWSELRDMPVELLAFLCLRWELETGIGMYRPYEAGSHKKARLNILPPLDLPNFRDRTPRLAWRAAFLAMYSSWYGRILRSNSSDVTPGKLSMGRSSTNFIFSRNKLSESWFDQCLRRASSATQPWFEGDVCFLSIPGMPLWPFERNGP